MKKLLLLLGICLSLLSSEIVVFENEYNILLLEKKVKKIVIGSKDIVGVSILDEDNPSSTLLKIFGKKRGNTSLLVIYSDKTIQNYRIYVNENLSHIQRMINYIEPNIFLSKVANESTVISGEFSNPQQKKRVYALLEKAGIDIERVMDISKVNKVSKMVRTKLYLVEINNQTAKDLGGVTGLSFFSKYTDIVANAKATTGVTFSGFLLDNFADFSSETGNSIVGTLNFLQEKGIAKILDDTVLLTTEDKNASFRVGGEVYIPVGVRDNGVGLPTIELEEKEYGLSLTLNTFFMEKDDFMHINVDIEDSAFDTTKEHNVQLGEFTTVPSFISKNIKTDIIAQSGQTIALGGRLHKEGSEHEEKVPLLGDIPLLGELFKRTVSGEKNNDILFFLVPEIVDANTDLDDSNYYEEFKKSSIRLHEKIDKIEDKITATISKEERELLQKNSNKEEQEALVTKTSQDEISLQTEEESLTQVIEISSNERVVEDEESTLLEELKVEEIPIEQSEQETLSDEKLYEVGVGKIFLRERPLDGKRVSVWKMGHKFKASGVEEVDSTLWLKVKEDCFDECLAVDEELWISEKYTREL